MVTRQAHAGWEHVFIHEWHDFLSAVIEGGLVPDHQATFKDGCETGVLCDAILSSAREGRRVAIAGMTGVASSIGVTS